MVSPIQARHSVISMLPSPSSLASNPRDSIAVSIRSSLLASLASASETRTSEPGGVARALKALCAFSAPSKSSYKPSMASTTVEATSEAQACSSETNVMGGINKLSSTPVVNVSTEALLTFHPLAVICGASRSKHSAVNAWSVVAVSDNTMPSYQADCSSRTSAACTCPQRSHKLSGVSVNPALS